MQRTAVEGPPQYLPEILAPCPDTATVGRLAANVVVVTLGTVVGVQFWVGASSWTAISAEEECVAQVGVYGADGGQDAT